MDRLRDALTLSRLVIFASVVVVLLIALNIMSISSAYEDSQMALQEATEALQAAEAEKSSVFGEDALSESEVRSALSSAADAGSDVAQLQNQYAKAMAEADTQGMPVIAEKLDAYLAADSKNERVPWSGLLPQGRWSFESTYDFDGDALPCIWLCKGGSDNVYAYATGIYDAASGTFGSVSHHLTKAGQSALEAVEEVE